MSTLQLDETGVITTCPNCGQRNRIAFSARESRCGKCKADLPLPAEPIEVPDEAAFDALVQNAALPIVIDFWAPWCGPCRMVAPEIARVASSNPGRLIVVKVNTDLVPELGERFGIRSIPTMAVFDRGREVARTSGAMPAAEIEAFVRGATPGRF
jgi:thioredoxin 2